MVADNLARTVNRLLDDRTAEPDPELLRRFVAARDEAAFAALVRRHGPMVFGVCRRTLGHVQDAEDAFQATFLVLARKAHTVRPDGVSRWLYGVAVRVSNKARVRRARRLPVPAELNEIPDSPGAPPADWLPLFDAALARLPERDRGPILLCDLLGRSRAEAAVELGLGEGTLSSRLARARHKLRARLTRLGIVPGVLTVAALAPEAVPAALIESTGAAASPAARTLAEGVLRSMALKKLAQFAAASVCVVGTLTAGVVWLPAAGAGPTPGVKEAPKDPAAKPPAKPAKSDAERFRGTWVIESARRNGAPATSPNWVGEEMTFERDSVQFARFSGRAKEYKLDPGWDLKRINFILTENPGGPGAWRRDVRAIYRFEGDRLHLVLGIMDFDERPDTFDLLDSGPPFTHLLLRRKVTDKDPAADERTELEGTWVAVAVEQGGKRIELGRFKLVFAGSRARSVREDKVGWEADYTVDPTTSPRLIDFRITTTVPEGMKPGTVLKGLYSLDRGLLTLCAGQPDGPRPTALGLPSEGSTLYLRREGDDRGPPVGTLPAPGTPGARVRQLQQERVKVLEEQLKGQFERVKIGKDPLGALTEAARELCAAELDLATTPDEKVAAVTKLFKQLQDVEVQVKALHEAGLQTKEGVNQATAARLKAEIELEKLKADK